eukprot:TRINITY_DN9331_c0_g1_i1.p1 TRINITY_DN9331_c0_g1~~TRINITY_DN9331_c0_g1_i1.p1  ORF type:complete len:408 (-),score=139.37 TRINITY_DN9331_c0_g1_i1:15-1238(-)
MSNKAIILVGGPNKGTRFRPLSLEVPKPLFPIAGRPMIYHHVEACAQANVSEVFLLGFFPETDFSSFMEETSKELNIKITYLNEVNVLGTAGGLYHFRSQLLNGNPNYVFVLHADVCCSFPLNDLMDFHKKHNSVCTIMGTKVPREYATHYGCLVTDSETQELLHYAEKPESFISDEINSGVYCLSPQFFEIMGKVMKELAKEETTTYESEILGKGKSSETMRLEQDVFVRLAGNKQVYVFPYNGYWKQIKNAGASVYCNDMYTKHYATTKPQQLVKKSNKIIGNVIIHPSAQVDPTAVIGPNVTIGANAKIGKGVRIQHAIILEGAQIKDHSFVSYSILGWRTIVGVWARIEGLPNHTPLLNHQGKRQGVTIVGNEAEIGSEVVIRNCIVMPHKSLGASCFDEILL